MVKQHIPTKDEVESYLRDRRNWGRWGNKGHAGTINLVTSEKRISATKLVKTGRVVSLSRVFPVAPSVENPQPAQHFMYTSQRPRGWGSCQDFYGVSYHGTATTHIDALCHVWTEDGMWEGRDPKQEITFKGAKFGSVDAWRNGILTRGVLLDVPNHRDKPFVTLDEPVHGWELEEITKEIGVTLEPGDAVAVYSGREAYAEAHGAWGGGDTRPGLHASCLPFIRDHDISVLIWDMMDAVPNDYDIPQTVHAAIPAYGLALLDNALLQPLAEACAQENRYEFMLTINPLVVVGGTGSPVNPIGVF